MESGALVDIEEARRIVLARAEVLSAESVPLEHALGRVLAQDVRAAFAVPAFDGSAMDGFAVRRGDVAAASARSPVRLRLAGKPRAGAPCEVALAAGEAIAISTGAVVPDGSDAVVPIENAQRDGEGVLVLCPPSPSGEIRRAGEDLRAGELALARGCILGAAELGVLASTAHGSVACTRRPVVSVLVSGDELLAPEEPVRPGGVRDTNSFTVPALARCAGARVVRTSRVRDSAAETREALRAALADVDVAVVCGGVSVGEHDHVRGALAELGAAQGFWGIALKPGKPTWYGTLGATRIFGLPGNPVSAMVTFALLVRPLLRALLGAHAADERISASLAVDYRKRPGRAHALRCGLRREPSGWVATPTGAQGSHVLSSMVGADALAIIPAAAGEVRAGEPVEIEPLGAAL